LSIAGLLELLPWLRQWHNEPDAASDGAIPAVRFEEFQNAQCAEHGFTYDDLHDWRPTAQDAAARPPKAERAAAKERAAGEADAPRGGAGGEQPAKRAPRKGRRYVAGRHHAFGDTLRVEMTPSALPNATGSRRNQPWMQPNF
jgi:hypothetical protein